MEVYRGHQHVPTLAQGAAVAIGNFDGVHRGHRALIAKARELAGKHGGGMKTLALTFDPHPSALFGKEPRPMISSIERRIELLGEAGADIVVIEPFTRELASKTHDQFIDDIVLGALCARAVVVGYDFSYGQGRAGNTDALRVHCGSANVDVAIVEAVTCDGEVASSTKIRQHLREGDLRAAERLLGRRWDVDGIVVHGAKRGRTIGVPTANIKPDSDLPLRPGIYAVTLAVEGGAPLAAVASLGTNPTFVEGGSVILEVHVLDFDGDLYDKHTRTTFVQHLRDEAKYDSIEALIEQIRRDIDAARQALR